MPNPPSMPAPTINCNRCVFWSAFGEQSGTCRRYAPPPSQHVDDTGYWPETLALNRCAEAIAAADPEAPVQVRCADCAFWFRFNPEQGLFPERRGDLPMTWWRAAGFCIRHAPRAEYQSVVRTHWRATHGTNHCGEGVRRAPES